MLLGIKKLYVKTLHYLFDDFIIKAYKNRVIIEIDKKKKTLLSPERYQGMVVAQDIIKETK